jgi:hypothetical protein
MTGHAPVVALVAQRARSNSISAAIHSAEPGADAARIAAMMNCTAAARRSLTSAASTAHNDSSLAAPRLGLQIGVVGRHQRRLFSSHSPTLTFALRHPGAELSWARASIERRHNLK